MLSDTPPRAGGRTNFLAKLPRWKGIDRRVDPSQEAERIGASAGIEGIGGASTFGAPNHGGLGKILVVTFAVSLGLGGTAVAGAELLRHLQWAWIPTRFWHAYQVSCLSLLALLGASAGVLTRHLLRGPEITPLLTFATNAVIYSLLLVRASAASPLLVLGPPNVTNRIHILCGLAIFAYGSGYLWAKRWLPAARERVAQRGIFIPRGGA